MAPDLSVSGFLFHQVETRQYRKASKALLVLIPLLGITYLVVLYGPNEGVGNHIFAVARAFLLSTQVNTFVWFKPSSVHSPFFFGLYSFLFV